MFSQYKDILDKVNIIEVLKARKQIGHFLHKTNLTYYKSLSTLLDARIYVKHENHNPTGSFKIRGALNFVSNITPEIQESGIVVASKGNHGMAMAMASQRVQLLCNIVVPVGTDPEKILAIQGYNAQVLEHGKDFYEAKDYCQELVENAGYYYVEQGNNPHVLNGIGTIMLEIFEELPEVDIVLMPIGSGSGISSLVVVRDAINPNVEILGVEPVKANAFYQSLKEGSRVILDNAESFADGLSARSVFEAPYLIIKDKIKEPILVTDEEIMDAVRMALIKTHNLAEGAGAASLAGAFKIKEKLKGKVVVIIMTGGNLDHRYLQKIMMPSS